jgi:hypothetical protein
MRGAHQAQVRHLHDSPLIFAGPMWKGLVAWASAQILRPGFELAGPQDMQIPTCVDGADQAGSGDPRALRAADGEAQPWEM